MGPPDARLGAVRPIRETQGGRPSPLESRGMIREERTLPGPLPSVGGRLRVRRISLFLLASALAGSSCPGMAQRPEGGARSAVSVEAGAERPIRASASELRDTVERYTTDLEALLRRYPVEASPGRTDRLRAFQDEWRAHLEASDYDALSGEGRIDWHLLRNRL